MRTSRFCGSAYTHTLRVAKRGRRDAGKRIMDYLTRRRGKLFCDDCPTRELQGYQREDQDSDAGDRRGNGLSRLGPKRAPAAVVLSRMALQGYYLLSEALGLGVRPLLQLKCGLRPVGVPLSGKQA